MKKMYFYLKADFKRSICSIKFILSVILIICVLLLATQEGIVLDTDVLYVFSIVMYGMPAMIILVCGAIAFADSFCEDMEYKYVMQQVIRGDLEKYVTARVLSIFCVTMISTTLGIFLFTGILHISLPWVDISGLQYDHIIHAGGLRLFLIYRLYPLYYLCYGIQYGVLVGIMALWASCLSMYISNRMLVLSAPMIIYYFTDYVLAEVSSGMLSLAMIFSPSNNLFLNDFLSVTLVIGIAVMNLYLTRKIMVISLRGKIYE
ncbi:MAG: hypothetical protein HFI19_07845 [Lachnospiraceae bacterium]|nr:hypothetical protein [Lachnospiraceae bacterium]